MRLSILAALAVLALALAGCGGPSTPAAPPTPVVAAATTPPAVAPSQEPSPFRFREVAKAAGIDFVQHSGMTAARHFPSANGSGVAIFDADGDGRMDLYFCTATNLPVGSVRLGPNRFYRNLGGGKFEDRTAASGLGFEGFSDGIIVGDADNDGDQDVYVCNYGPNILYLNDGKGVFRDATKAAGMVLPPESWSSGGAWLDYNNDGNLDLYVSRYGEWLLPRDDQWCGDREKDVRQYCSPALVKTVKHLLYRNDGPGPDGTPRFTNVYDDVFTDEARKKIPGRSDGHGFGVVAADLDGDGKVDLFVANDQNPNFLFLNNGNGTFRDVSESSGAALDGNGNTRAGMGAEAEDLDGDGKPELFVTNFRNEPNTVYQNLGGGLFIDQTASFGGGADVMEYVKWGCSLGDFDNDGWPDAFVTNGHVDNNHHLLGNPIPYEERPSLLRNTPIDPSPNSGRRFRPATRGVGAYFDSGHVGRGVASGDLDDDGRLDLVVNHKDAPPAVLLNETPEDGNHWVRLKLVGTKGHRDAIGARVEVSVGDSVISRLRKGGTSMLSSHDPRLLIGVGPAKVVPRVTVRWPSGIVQVVENVEVGKTTEIVEKAVSP